MYAKVSLRSTLIIALALALLGSLAGPKAAALAAPAADTNSPSATVNTGRLNVRAGPGIGYTVVTQIDRGQAIDLLARNSSATWVQVRLANGIEGWVSARYISANVPIADLPVSGSAPAPAPITATVTASQLELRSGPGAQHGVIAILGQGNSLTLLGRTADSAWVKVRASSWGEGWVLAQVRVVLPGNENGVLTATFRSSAAISSLPVVGAAAQPRAILSSTAVRTATPVFITVEGFPANKDVAAVLTSRLVPNGFVAATGKTDANGNAQLFFRMPDAWPSGAQIVEANLSLAVGTTDGSVLVWNGLSYRP